ncbi:DMT family transporter [Enterovibrio nigricans]|uniref:EamA-like transporter family protein n=1 Tax=Enterovibrio nigricans DSM 22720 TaxID=1121868 RepID=A0A1T4V5S8_9GAMM|nr:DMT family transporter [Enterovibrio nigricans]PKF49865.1 EamA/RhaT family transporter [Enterovibrio nigricans]SKA60244.1 EamA-like transporter family protein [Enterovibrio nigricans DSM 22720]
MAVISKKELTNATMAMLALLFFAANSVLCRIALAETDIDPASFTSIRLVSGAMVLFFLAGIDCWRTGEVDDGCKLTHRPLEHWLAAAMLFLYAATFSFAYLYLDTGVGALVLFAFVQLTMFAYSHYKEGGASGLEYIGALTAICGLGYLVSPGLHAPDMWGAFLMAIAGVAWGAYSVLGKEIKQPQLKANCINFRLSLFFVVPFFLLNIPMNALSADGIWLAIASGAIASAVGYAIWYWVVKQFKATQAGVMQLTVPLIAAYAGFLFLDEALTMRMVIAATVILLGIAVTFFAKERKQPAATQR